MGEQIIIYQRVIRSRKNTLRHLNDKAGNAALTILIYEEIGFLNI